MRSAICEHYCSKARKDGCAAAQRPQGAGRMAHQPVSNQGEAGQDDDDAAGAKATGQEDEELKRMNTLVVPLTLYMAW